MESASEAYRKASTQLDREKLILDNLMYVRKILSTLTAGMPSHFDRENLEQAGMVGLVETANTFDPSRGVAFRTYAYPRIRGAIVDEMRKNSPVPQQILEIISKLKSAYEKLQPPVTPEMLAEETGLPLRKVDQGLEAMRFLRPQEWNDLFCTIHASWKDKADTPDAHLEKHEIRRVVADCIERLPDQERLVLTLYFAEDLNLAEIGEVIDLSESRVSRILASAKFRLKEMVQAELEHPKIKAPHFVKQKQKRPAM